MNVSKFFSDKTAWLLVLLYVLWTRFFNFYLLSSFVNWYKIEESIILILFILMIPSIFRGLQVPSAFKRRASPNGTIEKIS